MKDIEIIDNEHSLLVSDSNEVSEQFDSRRLKYSLLLELSQDCLFNRHLGIMNGYLSTNQFDVKYDVQTSAYERVKQQWDSIKNVQWDGKFKVVPG